MSGKKYYIPKSLDKPFRIYLLTIDELLVLVLPIIVAYTANFFLLGCGIGVAGLMLLKKFKGQRGYYFLAHLAYWYFPNIVKFKATPPSHIRRYLG